MFLLLCVLVLVTRDAASVDPSDPKVNLDYFVRAIGSKDPNVSLINYFNGTIFAKQPETELQKLFNFEGFNINRKLPQQDGSYLSLSREIGVYRNPNTSEILKVWINPWTDKANEVFTVANDPVNGLLELGSIIPYQTILGRQIVFNADFVLEYPNPLPPANYSTYSAGTVYDAVELFGYFSNLSALENPQTPSVPMVGTWIRKAQYLPWMELSNSTGSLFYTTLNWKCDDLVNCLADDILELVNNKYSKYKDAPTEDVEPNETSWTAFKGILDQRRAKGQPDIIIPQVPIVSNLTTKETFIDDRVLAILNRTLTNRVTFNGSAFSEIIGKQSVSLINFVGFAEVDFEHLPTHDGYRIQLDGNLRFVNSSGKPITFWKNPITGRSVIIKSTMQIGVDFVVKKEFIYTMDMKPVEMLGLILAFSTDEQAQSGTTWSSNFADIIFENPGPRSSTFYGTAGRFSSWPAWMEMGDTPGNLVAKVTLNGS